MSKRNAENRKKWNAQSETIRGNVVLSMFAAIIIVLNFTPIGFLNLGLIKATIIHVPVIIGAVLLGPKRGAVLGLLFGACSLVVNTATPSLLSFAFSPLIPVPGMGRGSLWALLICFIPRLLVGILPYYAYRAIRFFCKEESSRQRTVTLAVTGALGSFVNTGFVMALIYFVFKDAYAAAKNIPVTAVLGAIMGVVGVNGVPEALAAALLVTAVCFPLQKAMKLDALQPGKGRSSIKGKEQNASPKPVFSEKTAERGSRENGLSKETREALSAFEKSTDTQPEAPKKDLDES